MLLTVITLGLLNHTPAELSHPSYLVNSFNDLCKITLDTIAPIKVRLTCLLFVYEISYDFLQQTNERC